MASIRTVTNSDQSTSYQVIWRDPELRNSRDQPGRQTSLTYSSRDAAEEMRRLLNANGQRLSAAKEVLRRKAKIAGGKPTVMDLLNRHIDNLTGITVRTRHDYRRQAAIHFGANLGPLLVDEVTWEHIARWVNAQTLSPKTVANLHGLLSAAFTTAVVKLRWRTDNPCTGVRLPRVDTDEDAMLFLDYDEVSVLVSEFADHWKPFVKTLVGTGMRWGEATAARVGDVRLNRAQPLIAVARAWQRDEHYRIQLAAPKSRRGRRPVSIGPGLVDILTPVVEGRPDDAWLFVGERGGLVRYKNWWPRVWRPAVERAMDPDRHGEARLRRRPRIHDLRHTHASWMLAEGMDVTVLSRRLGHTSIQTTVDRYGHLVDEHLQRAADAADRSLERILPVEKRDPGEVIPLQGDAGGQ